MLKLSLSSFRKRFDQPFVFSYLSYFNYPNIWHKHQTVMNSQGDFVLYSIINNLLYKEKEFLCFRLFSEIILWQRKKKNCMQWFFRFFLGFFNCIFFIFSLPGNILIKPLRLFFILFLKCKFCIEKLIIK